MEIKRDNVQVLNQSWFLCCPSKNHPRAMAASQFLAIYCWGYELRLDSSCLVFQSKVLTLIQRRHYLCQTRDSEFLTITPVGSAADGPKTTPGKNTEHLALFHPGLSSTELSLKELIVLEQKTVCALGYDVGWKVVRAIKMIQIHCWESV